MSVVLNIFLLVLFSMIISSQSDALVDMLLVNGVVQITLFILVACIPFLKTGRVSYVDIAWPFGVALIGAQILFLSDADFTRKLIVGGVYLFIGLRMGLGALAMAKNTGVIFKTEFPRYRYRRMLLDEKGSKYTELHLLAEIMAQGFANMTVLALPGLLIVLHGNQPISGLEVLGICIWLVAYVLESISDGQKLVFMLKNKGKVCNIGLWKYSRHPNYFSEWLVWTGLVIAAIPAWLSLQASESVFVWASLGIGTLCASVMMYITLVYLTGAKPSEHYSVQKRKDYKAYQETTNMFFPWFPKK